MGWSAVERLRERVVGGREEESENKSEPEREGQLRSRFRVWVRIIDL